MNPTPQPIDIAKEWVCFSDHGECKITPRKLISPSEIHLYPAIDINPGQTYLAADLEFVWQYKCKDIGYWETVPDNEGNSFEKIFIKDMLERETRLAIRLKANQHAEKKEETVEFFDNMVDVMPYRLSENIKPYILEALSAYAEQQTAPLKARIKELEAQLKLNKQVSGDLEKQAQIQGIYAVKEHNVIAERHFRLGLQAALSEATQGKETWVKLSSKEPELDKYYQLAFNDDVYLQVFKYLPLDLSPFSAPCFNDINCKSDYLEIYEVSHYREFNTDAPDWAELSEPTK